MTRAHVALAFALLSVSCGAPLMKLPTGPGVPTSNGRAALDEATDACRRVTSMTAEIGVKGSVAGRRVRATLLAGLRAPASARLEAAAPFGAPFFILVADGTNATLLLPRDDRVLEHGETAAVVEAIAGVPLDGGELKVLVTGCALAAESRDARQLGDDWLVVPDAGRDVYLTRKPHGAPWQIAATVHRNTSRPPWRAEYQDRVEGLPRAIRLVSDGGRFDLRLTLSQVETNVPLTPEAFRLRIPASAVPITLSELGDAGPFRAPEGHGR